jgi:anti-anti-sigma regulatory factor
MITVPASTSHHYGGAATSTTVDLTDPCADGVPGRLVVRSRVIGSELRLLVRGEADMSNAEQLRDELIEAIASWPHATVIDVSGLTFCGLAGLDALQAAQRAGTATGRQVGFAGMSRQLSWLDQISQERRGTPTAPRVASPAPV